MSDAGSQRGKRGGRQTSAQAIVLRRRDFRESSRIVTVLTREHGKITGLAKGAHRPDSPLLGRIDFLNELDATFSADRGGLRLLVRARLLRERRGLRAPLRFLAAGHIAWLVDAACAEGRPDPAMYDLLLGGLNLLERCPIPSLRHVVLGLEVRYLDALGALPDLAHCSECGVVLDEQSFRQSDTMGLACRRHAGLPRHPLRRGGRELLLRLQRTPGRDWPGLEIPIALVDAAATLPAHWITASLEQRPPHRRLLFPTPHDAAGRAAN